MFAIVLAAPRFGEFEFAKREPSRVSHVEFLEVGLLQSEPFLDAFDIRIELLDLIGVVDHFWIGKRDILEELVVDQL